MNWMQAPRMQVVWEVLESARETGDKSVVDACVRLIHADRRGGRKQADDWRIVKEFPPA
jgi:hypothetical protein